MTRLPSTVKRAPVAKGGRLPGRSRTLALALVAITCGLMLSASAARPDFPPSNAVTAAATTVRSADVATPAGLPQRRAAAVHSQHITALTSVIARKYRVSEEATREYLSHAYREGEINGLDPLLIVAVMAVESRFNPVAESHAGAVGLMQVIPRFHTDKFALGRESALHPHTNIRIGARALKEYIRRGGSQIAGLQLYNGAADDPSTAYANKVLGERQRLQGAVKGVSVRA